MCGIAGIVTRHSGRISEATIQAMTAVVAHRGPDGQAVACWPQVALGHRRLAILDLDRRADQPMTRGALTLVFNGEIYNYLEIKAILEEKGHIFSTTSDSEVILAAYAEWGTDCLTHFNGMWAFVLYDQSRQLVFAARDRFGVKPFYYWQNSVGDWHFASEIKQFTVLPTWQPRGNQARIHDFLSKGWLDHTTETLFDGVHQLRGGQALVLDVASFLPRFFQYYDLETALKTLPPQYPTFQTAVEHVRHLFESAVALRLRADVRVGTSLSGGLDSSSIAVQMHQQLQNQGVADHQESVSAVFPQKKYDEGRFVAAVAAKTGLNAHLVHPDFAQFERFLADLVWYQDEPLATDSTFAQFLVFKKAQERGLKVMLDGQGADEVLGGYDVFFQPYFMSKWRKNPLTALSDLFWLTKRGLWSGFKPYLKGLLGPKNHRSWLNPDFTVAAHRQYGLLPTPDMRALSVRQTVHIGLPALLRFEDRCSMAHGVETRLPFLDYRLVAYLVALPDDHKIYKIKRKHILREAMRPFLPTEVYNRHDKLGFYNPGLEWMRAHPDFFRQTFKETLAAWPGVFAPSFLADFEALLEGKMPLPENVFWRVFFFGQWTKIFNIKHLE